MKTLPAPLHAHAPARRRQRGALAVEAALAMPILLGMGLVGTDLHRIGIERAQLEQAAGSTAITLAAQSELTEAGVQSLVDVMTLGRPQHYQLTIMSVKQSGRVNWALQRGGGGDLCTAMSDGRNYLGDLPESEPSKSSNSATSDKSIASMVVVQVCRNTDDIAMVGGLGMPEVVRVRAINRARSLSIKLDDALTTESQANGMADSES